MLKSGVAWFEFLGKTTMMPRFVTLLVLVLLVTGFGAVNHQLARLAGYSNECVDGVLFYRFPVGAAVHRRDGQNETC